MKRLILTAALGLALSSPAALAQQSQAQKSGQQQAAGVPAVVQLTSAYELAGRTVYDRAGNQSGEIEYLLIDSQTGRVRYAMIGSGGVFDIGDDLTPVPLSSLQIFPGADGRVNLTAGLDTLRQGQRFSTARLADLTEPALVTQVYNLYAPPEGSGASAPGESGSAEEEGSGSSGRAAQNQPQGQSGGGESALLVGRHYISVLAAPALQSSDTIRGTSVQSRTGELIGDIDQVMIDTQRGHVAYVLIGRGGFLGLGEEWVPVPFQALSWSGSGDGFTLNASQQQLQQMQPLQKENLPAQVSGADIKALYDRFGVPPYWQRG